MASRHFALPTVSLRNPYKIWMPTDKNIDSDSDNERYRSHIRTAGQSNSSLNVQEGQHMAASYAYHQDGYLARTVSSPAPLPSNTYLSQPSSSNSNHDNSTQTFTKQHARRATTTSVMAPQTSTSSSHKNYLHALDPRTYLSKRSHTDKANKGALNNSTEQLSSAEEGGKESRKSRHSRSSSKAAASSATVPRSGRHPVPHNEQAAKVSSSAPVDYDHDERAKRRLAKDERTNHDLSGFDRLFPGVSPTEGHSRLKTTADVEAHYDVGAYLDTSSFPSGQRNRTHTQDSSQKGYPLSSSQTPTPLTKGTLATLRAATAHDVGAIASKMFSPLVVVATLPTTSSQSTVRDHHVRSASTATAPRGGSPLPPHDAKNAKDKAADKVDIPGIKERERSKLPEKDRHHAKKEHARTHRHHREKASSLPANNIAAASGSDSDQLGVKESHHQRIAGHTNALRANHALISAESSSNLLQEALAQENKRSSAKFSKSEGPVPPEGRRSDELTVGNRSMQDAPAVPPKSPKQVDKLRLEPTRTSTPLEQIFTAPVASTPSSALISQNASPQTPGDRIPSRTGRRTPSTAYVTSPTSAGISPKSPISLSPRQEIGSAPLGTGHTPIAVSRSVPTNSQQGSTSSHTRHAYSSTQNPPGVQYLQAPPMSRTSSNNSHNNPQSTAEHGTKAAVTIPRNLSNSSVANQNIVTSPKLSSSQQYIQPALQDSSTYPTNLYSHQDLLNVNQASNPHNFVPHSQMQQSVYSSQVLSSSHNVSNNEPNAPITPHTYKTFSRPQDQQFVSASGHITSRPPPYEKSLLSAEQSQGRYETLPPLPQLDSKTSLPQTGTKGRHAISPAQSILLPKSKRGNSAPDAPSIYHAMNSAQSNVRGNSYDSAITVPKTHSDVLPSGQPPLYQSVSSETYHVSLSSKHSSSDAKPILSDHKLSPDDAPPFTGFSSSPESYEEILVKPYSHSIVAPQPRRPEENTKKKGLLSLFKSSSKSNTKHEIWYPPTPGPNGRRDKAPTKSANSSQTMVATQASLDIEIINSKLSRPTPEPINIPGSGRKSPAKPFGSIRVFGSKRYRSVSVASLEAVDGTANNTVVGSPTSSMRTSTPGPYTSPSPPLRDPLLATQEWRNNEERDMEDRGTHRRRRPGVTFDISEDEMPKSRENYRMARASRIYNGE